MAGSHPRKTHSTRTVLGPKQQLSSQQADSWSVDGWKSFNSCKRKTRRKSHVTALSSHCHFVPSFIAVVCISIGLLSRYFCPHSLSLLSNLSMSLSSTAPHLVHCRAFSCQRVAAKLSLIKVFIFSCQSLLAELLLDCLVEIQMLSDATALSVSLLV